MQLRQPGADRVDVGIRTTGEFRWQRMRAEPGLLRHSLEILLQLLAPFTPHFANELWARLGHDELLDNQGWPAYDQRQIDAQTVNLMIQINGKIRDKLVVALGLDEAEASRQAQELEKIKPWLQGKTIVKTIYVPDKMLSFVVK